MTEDDAGRAGARYERLPKIRLESRKYDGRLHYHWPAYILEETAERLVLYRPPGQVFTHITRNFSETYQDYNLICIWPGRWYNISATYHNPERFSRYYCNIGLPPERAGDVISWIDLDVDVVVRGTNPYIIEDEDEFILHSAQFGYPSEVVAGVRRAQQEIIDLIEQKREPFDGTLERFLARALLL